MTPKTCGFVLEFVRPAWNLAYTDKRNSEDERPPAAVFFYSPDREGQRPIVSAIDGAHDAVRPGMGPNVRTGFRPEFTQLHDHFGGRSDFATMP
jgi:hypothetical protein